MTAPALIIQDLKFRYRDASRQHVNAKDDDSWTVNVQHLELPRGGQLLLTGGSGSGKSTLLHLIAGLIDPHQGSVLVSGQDIHMLRGAVRDLLRGSAIGMIFQTFNLLHGFSAIENVLAALMFADRRKFPARSHRHRAAALLAELGIDRIDADPDRLSVGQQQRVAVARALACEPALVLADEPTASLDPESAAGAMNLIQRTCAAHGAALLCVSHDPALAECFDRRAMLDSGRIHASQERNRPDRPERARNVIDR